MKKQQQVVQPHIPGLARVDKKAVRQRRSEAVLQQHTRAVLASVGYASMETGLTRPHVECPQCQKKFVPTGWMGNSVGCPDLLVFRYAHFPAVAILVEMKGEKTPITREQKALAEAGRTVIAYSEGDALRAVLAAEEAMDAYQFLDERRQTIKKFLELNEGNI